MRNKDRREADKLMDVGADDFFFEIQRRRFDELFGKIASEDSGSD